MVDRKLDERTYEFNVGTTGRLASLSLFVREIGHGPAVIVLHGGPGAQHDYLFESFSQLADEFRLVFYDQRGGGRSTVEFPRRVGWRDHVGDLEALRRELGIRRLVLLGYSWGGLLALLYAADYPQRVQALALLSPAAGWGDYRRRFRKNLTRRSRSKDVERLQAELEASGLETRDPSAYRQRRFDLSVAGYYRDPRDAAGSSRLVVQLQVQRATWASLEGYGPQLRRKTEGLQVPALVLHGRYDPIPLEWAEELVGILPQARLVVLENSGHVPYVEEPDRTFAEIRGFLREHADR
jgi:proline iminopeptidase